MNYTLTTLNHGKYILLKVTGEVTRKWMMQLLIAAHRRGLELGIERFLIDLRQARYCETVLNTYALIHWDLQQEPAINRRARTALLLPAEDDSYTFMETVLCNAGLSLLPFKTLDLALNYLLQNGNQ